MAISKLVLDAGPIINLSREEIVSQGKRLFATPAVIREIRDENARRKLELLKQDITVQQPTKEAVTYVKKFTELTGDNIVLSSQDIEVIALAYDLCEDKTRIRTEPKVSSANYNSIVEPTYNDEPDKETEVENKEEADDGWTTVSKKVNKKTKKFSKKQIPEKQTNSVNVTNEEPKEEPKVELKEGPKDVPETPVYATTPAAALAAANALEPKPAVPGDDDDSDWSDDGWINPANLEQMKLSANTSVSKVSEEIDVAVSTRDYAVQNSTMQMGIAAVNEKGLRIKQLRNYMQRCYACFTLIPLDPKGNRSGSQTVSQFCPQCGGHTLTRVSTSLDRYGQLHINLKKNIQWITRGDRYNIPTPQSFRARRERHDTKKELYAEDQPEYLKALKKQNYLARRNDKSVAEYVGPSTVDSAVSPFVGRREMTAKVHIGRGRYANNTGTKTEYSLH